VGGSFREGDDAGAMKGREWFGLVCLVLKGEKDIRIFFLSLANPMLLMWG
jgi:hypothetical protein